MGLCLGINWNPAPPILPREPSDANEHDMGFEFHSDWGLAVEMEHLRDCLPAHWTGEASEASGWRSVWDK